MPLSRTLRILLYLLTSLVSVTTGLVVWEALYVGLFADADGVKAYYFGGAAMLGHGGPHYRSAGAYVASTIAISLPLVLATTALVSLLWRFRSDSPTRFPWHHFHPRRLATGAAFLLIALGLVGLLDPRNRSSESLAPHPAPPERWPPVVTLATGLVLGGLSALRHTPPARSLHSAG